MDKQQQDAIALRQAQNDIARALQRLEQETGRHVSGVSIVDYRMVGDDVLRRIVEVQLSPPPSANWATS
jgi:hypothetical protein